MALALAALMILSLIPWDHLLAHAHGHAHGQDHTATQPPPCPDGSPDDAPCPEGCACLCCPGHARIVLLGAATPLERAACIRGAVSAPVALNPHDAISRVFRPPRADLPFSS